MAPNAWLFDPAARTVDPVDFRRDAGEIDVAIKGPAFLERCDPREYNCARDLLGAPSALKVSPYAVHETKRHVYKAWIQDREANPAVEPGVRFFRSTARFHGKVVLVKYERHEERPRIRYEELVERIFEPGLFYEPASIVAYARPDGRFEWTTGIASQVNGFLFDGSRDVYEVHDLMYTCAACGKCCGGKRCARCRKAFYCDARCQRLHWPDHKRECCRDS